MDRTIHLFRDILGFELAWRIPRVGGRKLSTLLQIPNMEAELAYLKDDSHKVAIELCRSIGPSVDPHPAPSSGKLGSVGLCMTVKGLDALYERLTEEGWIPHSPCMEMESPEGEPFRIFCVRTEEGLMLELMEPLTMAKLEG